MRNKNSFSGREALKLAAASVLPLSAGPMTAAGDSPVKDNRGGGDCCVVTPKHRMFEGTEIKKGDYIPGVVGRKFTVDAADIKGTGSDRRGIAFQGGIYPAKWQLVIYSGPRGNFVFNASRVPSPPRRTRRIGHTLLWSRYNRPHGAHLRVQGLLTISWKGLSQNQHNVNIR